MDQYKTMFEAAVKALAEIDDALGIGADGCNDKGGVEDLKKARHYLDKLIEAATNE